MPNVITVDGNVFIAREITGLFGTTLPTVTDSGGVRRATVGDKLRFLTEPPGFIGFPESEDPHALDDAINVLTMWGAFMRGPQKQLPTITPLPTIYKIDGLGFFETRLSSGRLRVYGNGASSSDEPVFSFSGSGSSWADSTLNADLTGDVTAIAGMVNIAGADYAAGRQLVAGEGSNNKILYKATSLNVWANYVDNGVAETLAGGADRLRFLIAAPDDPDGNVVSCGFTAAGSQDVVLIQRVIDTSSTAGWTTYGNPVPGTDPRGLLSYPGPDGDVDTLVSTEIGLFHVDFSTANHSTHFFLDSTSSFSGRMTIGADGLVYFLDGQLLYRLLPWTGASTSNRLTVEVLGAPTLPSDADDVFTAIAASKQRPWIYLARGGVKSTTNARLMIYNYRDNVWYGAPYQNGTAQRVIIAIIESSLEDGTTRLHMVEEQASGGDQHPVNFPNFAQDPRQNSAFTSEGTLTMRIIEPDRGFGDRGLFKGMKYVQGIGDNFSANEKLTPEFEHDGGSKSSNGLDITADGGIQWPDGSAGIGVKARRQKITWDLSGTAGTTQGPWVKAFVSVASVFPQTSGGNIPEKRRFLIDFRKGKDRTANEAAVADTWSFAGYLDQQGTANAWANLRTSAAKGVNIVVKLDDKTSFAGDIVIEDDSQVRYVPEDSRPGATLQIDGVAIISIEEVA